MGCYFLLHNSDFERDYGKGHSQEIHEPRVLKPQFGERKSNIVKGVQGLDYLRYCFTKSMMI